MFADARTLPHDTEIRTDVCIVGAGPAGITLARECIGVHLDVCLLESGGMDPDPPTQALAGGENVGVPYFDLALARMRVFGGSSYHWAGVCRPLDPMDFERRDWVRNSGWPLSKADLDPYYVRAHPICQLGPYDYELRNWQSESAAPVDLDPNRFQTALSQYSPPTRFGAAYREELKHAHNVRVLLFANLSEIETTPNAREVHRLRVACLGGNRFTVRARVYVLAAGAIENARLLLASNRTQPAGVGNDYDLVGRYFMEHPAVPGAVFIASRDRIVGDLYRMLPQRGTRRCGYLVPSPETQRREHLVNMRTFMARVGYFDALRWSSDAIRSADHMQESLRRRLTDGIAGDIWRFVRDLDDVAMYAYLAFLRPGPEIPAFLLETGLEQEPDPQSRVTLSNKRDALGMPEARLTWRLGELEQRSYQRSMELLGQEFGRAGLGRVRIIPADAPLTEKQFQVPRGGSSPPGWPPGVQGSFHHMGTTRMASAPQNGVVDAQCRVHGVANLYVAGSSVFPTGGHTNPTLTIVALALRLSDHLKQALVA